ncbi:Speckle-type POZ protein-like B [Araneus ventricosus]|uniref:Speckle-type POZ protein-like B n=1 Tax=Araneus ventricosus TaxID=182803 RepID=A0A4Y2GBD2_ARAVE|nr:Speckle-type POZ protein-like B [Araneus ventricosus]
MNVPGLLSNGKFKRQMQYRSQEQLSKYFERVLNTKSSCFADVTLKCGGISIPAHKIILSARSPVFAAMFANPMKESRENEVDITDIDESVLRALLMFMYTGKTSDLTVSSAADLFFGADKYQLPGLKTACSYFLKDSVSPQSVWRILAIGDLHDEALKSFAVDYICNKYDEFSVLENMQEWKALRRERPDLAIDVLVSWIKSREEKKKRKKPKRS